MPKNTFENSKLQLEVTNYCIVEDGTTLIELSVQNHAQITRIENEDHCSHATEFDRQTCLLDTLLFSIYSKVHAQNQKKNSFFLPIDFLVLKILLDRSESSLKLQALKTL